MSKSKVCSVERAGSLDNRFRKIFQNPQKVLKPYIKEGMIVLDLGCGPGFFTPEMARMAGNTGKVIAADLQEGMLRIVKEKIKDTPLEERVKLHKCEENKIGLTDAVDFVLAFYFVHEVPDREALFKEIYSILKPGGKMLIVEPPFHVSKKKFRDMLSLIKNSGFKIILHPEIIFNKAVLIQRSV